MLLAKPCIRSKSFSPRDVSQTCLTSTLHLRKALLNLNGYALFYCPILWPLQMGHCRSAFHLQFRLSWFVMFLVGQFLEAACGFQDTANLRGVVQRSKKQRALGSVAIPPGLARLGTAGTCFLNSSSPQRWVGPWLAREIRATHVLDINCDSRRRVRIVGCVVANYVPRGPRQCVGYASQTSNSRWKYTSLDSLKLLNHKEAKACQLLCMLRYIFIL